MMKTMKKIITILCALVISLTTCVGCKSSVPETATDIELIFWNAGTGRNFIDSVIVEFEKVHPEYKVHLVATAEVLNSTLYMDPKRNTADLYFSTMEDLLAQSKYLEPLDDVLKSKVDNSDITIEEKMSAEIVKSMRGEDGKQYGLSWASSVNGLIYNKSIFEKYGLKSPRTTNELRQVALDLKSEGETPFIHLMQYWRYVSEAWMAQYDGMDAYFDKWTATYTDADGVRHPRDKRAFTEQYNPLPDGTYTGAYYALNTLYDMVAPEGYVYNGSNSFSHTTSQTYFLDNRAAMMPNGSWIETEMKASDKKFNMGIMKTPVISELVNKIKVNGKSITDRQLSTLVKLADGEELTTQEKALIADVSDEDKELVRFSRNIHYTEQSMHHAFIPNYASAKDAAKEFLKFYYSDQGLRIISEGTRGPTPAKLSEGVIDTSNWSPFSQEIYERSLSANYIFKDMSDKLFYKAGITQLYQNVAAGDFTYSRTSSDVPDYIKRETAYWEKNWQALLKAAQLI